jgi:hypothetical protein
LSYRQRLGIARLALRVDRVYAAHAKLPASLDGVLDEKLPQVPICLFSGGQLIYRCGENQFSIYSPGPNSLDDGGGRMPDLTEERTRFDVAYPQYTQRKPTGT